MYGYKITKEDCGFIEQQYVIRHFGEWVGREKSEKSAKIFAQLHASRKADFKKPSNE